MRALRALAIIVFLSCRGESPTEPRMLVSDQVGTCSTGGAIVEPVMTVLREGSTATATVRLCYGPARLPWTITVGPPEIAEGHAIIDAGKSEVTLTIVGRSAGFGRISYLVPNIGRPPATLVIGSVQVVSNARRQAVRH